MNIKNELKRNMHENSGYLISSNHILYKKVIQKLIKPFKKENVDKVMASESKGFLYGTTIAHKLNKPFVPIFKSGRVPKKFVVSQQYKDYSKKQKSLDVGKITIKKGDKILIVDDVFESGESGKATIKLIEKLGGEVIGISVIYNKLNKTEEDLFRKYNFRFIVKMNN